MREMGTELKKGFARLTDLFTRLTELLKEGMDGEVNIGIASNQAEEWYPLFGSLLSRSSGNWELWVAFTAEDPEDNPPDGPLADPGRKRFAVRHRGQRQPDPRGRDPATQPVERGLRRLVTSATLTALGTFDRFRMRAGLPKKAVTAVVPSPFHHADAGVLRVPDLQRRSA